MGETAADTQREIEEIQKDISSAVSELSARISRAASPSTYLNMARENPAAVIGIAMVGMGIVGGLIARSAVEARRQNTLSARIGHSASDLAETLSEGLEKARAAVPALPMALSIGTGDAKQSGGPEVKLTKTEPNLLKRVMWAGLVAAMMALGGLIARRISAEIWKTAMNEAPPTKDV